MGFEEKHKNEINILFEMLREQVKDKFNFDVASIDEVKVKSRKRPMVYFRKMLMVILGEVFNKDYNQEEFANVVGLDRTSFIYHTTTHLNDYSRYSDYKEEYDKLRDGYLEKIGIE